MRGQGAGKAEDERVGGLDYLVGWGSDVKGLVGELSLGWRRLSKCG